MTDRSFPDNQSQSRTPAPTGRHGGHSWMMMICCIPMVAIAIALVATGVVGAGFLLGAGLCVAMMALMMRAMDHSGDSKHTA
jgi:hypothetical protein